MPYPETNSPQSPPHPECDTSCASEESCHQTCHGNLFWSCHSYQSRHHPKPIGLSVSLQRWRDINKKNNNNIIKAEISMILLCSSFIIFMCFSCSIVHPNPTLTLLWLPPPKYCVGGFGCRWQLDGHHLGLQEGTKVQLP